MIRTSGYGTGDKGQGLLEIVLAMAVFAFIAAALASLSVGGFRALQQGGDHTTAEALTQEGIEAVRTIRDRAWNENTFSGGAANAKTEINIGTGQWELKNTGPETGLGPNGTFTRTITFNNVCRDAANAVAPCPASYTDAHTKEVVVVVAWQTSQGGTNTVEKRTYITNWDSRDWKQNIAADFGAGTFGANTQASSLGDGASVTLKEL